MYGSISEEMEVKVSPNEAWKMYGTLRLAYLFLEKFPQMIQKIDVLEGDGGPGTLLLLTFAPGESGSSQHKEKFISIDNEKRVKVVDVIEGGILEHGVDLYRVRFEIIEKQSQEEEEEEKCISKVTIEYETKDLAAANLAVSSLQAFVAIMNAASDSLTNNKNNN